MKREIMVGKENLSQTQVVKRPESGSSVGSSRLSTVARYGCLPRSVDYDLEIEFEVSSWSGSWMVNWQFGVCSIRNW